MYQAQALCVGTDLGSIQSVVHRSNEFLLVDARALPASVSLDLLAALHGRWVPFLRQLSEDDFSRSYIHPALGPFPLYDALALYAWHGRHHAAHIRNALGLAVSSQT